MLKVEEIRPYQDRVLVKIVEAREYYRGGLILPNIKPERQHKGEIMAVGNLEHPVEIGDIAIFGKYSGHDFMIGADTYTMLKENEILATMRKEDFYATAS